MPNINDIFPSKYLKAHDLKGTSPTVIIDRVTLEQVRGRQGTDTKAVVYFRGKTKGMLFNKTNAQAVTRIAGSAQTERWAGVAVTLYPTTDKFGAETHDVIRIKAPAPVNGKDVTARRKDVTSSLPPVFTDELEIDLQDGGRR